MINELSTSGFLFATHVCMIGHHEPPLLRTTVQIISALKRHCDTAGTSFKHESSSPCSIQNVRYFERGDQSRRLLIVVVAFLRFLNVFFLFSTWADYYDVAEARATLCSVHFSSPSYRSVLVFIMWRNYQSAVFEYRIFDRNQNPYRLGLR